MAKYFIQDETLTNLADKIRVLNGTEESMTPSQMDSELGDANDEVDAQSTLIDQLSEMLDGKAAGGDVTSETNAYTNKLVTLETAINQLETELQGKTSGGSGGNSIGWINVTSLPSTYLDDPYQQASTYYYEVPENCIGIACFGTGWINSISTIIASDKSSGSFNTKESNSTTTLLRLSDADGTGTIVKIETAFPYTCFLPILSSDLS